MLYNCIRCAKTISSKKDICPYCKMETIDVGSSVANAESRRSLKEKYKGTIFSLVMR